MNKIAQRFLEFLDERKQAKLDKLLETDEKRQAIIEAHQPEVWIADAARRVSQIKLITHAIKYHNPDARGASVYYEKSNCKQPWLSTTSLNVLKPDVVGNAAALDVFKFLQLEIEAETLLSRILRDDPEVRAAFPGTEAQKDQWLSAFTRIAETEGPLACHTLAKQVYFPIEKGRYHLLSPLYPSSLVHAVFQKIQERFSDEVKAARKARSERKPYHCGYRDFFALAVQKFGGTKPQNISQLNSERGGRAYLLASFPPTWQSQQVKPPLSINSFFKFIFYGEVKQLTEALKSYLDKLPADYTNLAIREASARRVQKIIDAVMEHVFRIQELSPGWSSDATCQLSEAQRLWLDPGRTELEPEWKRRRGISDWSSEVASDFARWLKKRLETKHLRFGDDEYHEWKQLFERELLWVEDI